MLDITQKINTN